MNDFPLKDLIEYGALIGGAVAGMWYVIKQRNASIKKDYDKLDKAPTGLSRDGRIHDMLVELRTETRADRVQIFQFHNGDHYDNNVSIRRFSCCYEVVKDMGVASSLEIYQNCLLSAYVDGLRVFVESDTPATKLTYSQLSNGLYKSTMINTGVKMQIGITLKGNVKGEQKITGLLLLSYNEERELDRCSFDALVNEGHLINTDTDIWVQRVCDGSCDDCRFSKYTTRIETELAKVE